MPFDPHVHVGVGAVIVNPANLLLTIQRQGAHGEGQWAVPGGWIDYGESPEKAVLRELAEEVGMIGVKPSLLDVVASTFDDPVGHVVTLFYGIPYTEHTVATPRLEVRTVRQVLWQSFEELQTRDLFPPLKTYLDRAHLVEQGL